MVELVKAKVEEVRKIRIHNDLAQAAYHFKTVIEAKQSTDQTGITYDCMACATMLAFTWEAYLNFFGDAFFKAYWHERQELNQKVDQVYQRLKIAPDWSRRPYSSITTLTKLRNWLAHGKPIEKEIEKEVTDKAEKITNKKIDLSGNWQKLCNPDVVLKAHEDLDTIFKDMLNASGMSLFDTMTVVEGSIEFIEHVEVGE